MSAFEYTALDLKGKTKKGLLEGDTPRQIRQQLRERELTPLTVEEVRQRSNKSGTKVASGRGISSTELAIFTRQLATLIASGLPLEESLNAVGQQSENPRMKSTILAVRSRIKEGHGLAESLGNFPAIFPELYRSTVEAGEQTGRLDLVLTRLADYTESRQQLIQTITGAIIYPAVLTFVAISAVIGLLIFVVPKVVSVYADIGQTLPLLTRTMITISDLMRSSYGLAVVVLLVVGIITWLQLLKKEPVKRRYHDFLLRMPILKRLVRGVNTARFARTFSILTASGVPVLEGMRISAQVMANLPMRDAVKKATVRVREGSGIQPALQESECFPPIVLSLIGSGESSGKLEEMLERAAQNQEREFENSISIAMKIFEPALILLMGILVLMIVLAILLPIFDLNQLVK